MRNLLISTAMAAALAATGAMTANAQQMSTVTPVWILVLDKNKNNAVDGEERQQAREQQFSGLDQDKDGQLNRDELGGGVTREQTAEQMKEMDRNRDQQNSLEEYMQHGEQRYGEARQKQSGDQAGISHEDYSWSAGISPREAAGADRDRDQRISEAEAAHDTARRFRRLDQDQDGNLTHSELRQADRQLQLDRSFSALDADNDDQISREEFVNREEMQQQAGSQKGSQGQKQSSSYFGYERQESQSQNYGVNQQQGNQGQSSKGSGSSSSSQGSGSSSSSADSGSSSSKGGSTGTSSSASKSQN